MLFQKNNGQFVQLKRCDYVNDVEYYSAILRTKSLSLPTNVCNPDDRVLKAFKSKIVHPKVNSSHRNK